MTDILPVVVPESTPRKRSRKLYFLLLVLVVFFLGYGLGRGSSATGSDNALSGFNFLDLGRDRAPKTTDWNLLWDTIEKINQKYVDRPADMTKVLYGAVGGAVAALGDPYSVFFPPQQAEEFKKELSGNFEGIGAEIAVKNQHLTVVTPLDDSPAQKAGLKAGDVILKIGSQESKEFSLEEAVARIRGQAGSQVTLTVLRKGENATRDFTITRAKIVVKSTEREVKEYRGKKVGYIKMRRFGEDTSSAISSAISELLVKNVDSILLDLRSNPGGFLDAAVEIAGNWVPSGEVVVVQKFGDGSKEEYKSRGNARLKNIPTVVLLNGGSASASEILAGALRDHGLAKLVGEKSFGKGSVQELIELSSGAELKLTIAKWLTPTGHDLNKDGLEPDVKVAITEEDFQADLDPQLDKALELLVP